MFRQHGKIAISWLAGLALAGCALMPDISASSSPSAVDSEALVHVATAAEENGNYATAVSVLRKAIAAHPGDVALQVELGQALYGAGENDEAIKTFRTAIDLAPTRPDAHILLGRLYLIKDKPGEALIEFEAVLVNDPRQLKALNGKGIALDRLNRSREAQQCYRAALVVAPDDRAARNNLGLSLALSGAYDQAIDMLTKLVQEPGATPRMRQNLALAFGLKGDRSQAERIARRDLDETSTKINLEYFDTVRGLGAPATRVSPRQ